MKKLIPNIAGALLGLIFVAVGLMVLLELGPPPPAPPEGSPASHFFAAFIPTGYLGFVKICEVTGGLLVAIPRTRCLGLLILGPIVINILAFHFFVTEGDGLLEPMVLAVSGLSLFLLLVEHKAFLGLAFRRSAAPSKSA